MKKALVTGGCGFLGSAIVRQLLERGVKTRILALPQEPTDNVEGLDVDIVRGNVLDVDTAKKVVDGIDTLFHAAAIYKAWMPDPTLMYEVNLRGTFNMLEAARRSKVKRVVYTASIASLGRPPKGELGNEHTEYEAWDIDFAYSRSKYHSRVIAEDFANWGLDVRIVCPGLVLGPGDIGPTPSGQLIINAVKGGARVYMEGGATYVDVRDAASAHLLAVDRGKRGERYIATGHNLSNRELMQTIARVAGINGRFVKLPVRVARAGVMAMERAANRSGKEPMLSRNFFEYSLVPSYYSNEKAKRELGAEFRPIETTIADAIGYFREQGRLR